MGTGLRRPLRSAELCIRFSRVDIDGGIRHLDGNDAIGMPLQNRASTSLIAQRLQFRKIPAWKQTWRHDRAVRRRGDDAVRLLSILRNQLAQIVAGHQRLIGKHDDGRLDGSILRDDTDTARDR